ncbi:MAG: hypothetical protein ACI4NA_06055, partial [Succinivibrio sp.]
MKHKEINIMDPKAGKSAPGLIGLLLASMIMLAIGAAAITYLMQLRALRTNAAGACNMAIYSTAGNLDFYTRMADMASTMTVDYYFGYSKRMNQNLFSLYPALESISIYEMRNMRADRILHDGEAMLPHEQQALEEALADPSLETRYLVVGKGLDNSMFILSRFSTATPAAGGSSGYVALKVDVGKIIAETGANIMSVDHKRE